MLDYLGHIPEVKDTLGKGIIRQECNQVHLAHDIVSGLAYLQLNLVNVVQILGYRQRAGRIGNLPFA
jgi:hypothetical protein